MKVDDIIPLLGNFGRYQFITVAYLGLYNIISCFLTLGNVFYSAESDHWCRVLPAENCSSWPEFRDNCTEVKKSILLPPPERKGSDYPYSNCYQWDPPDGYVFDPYTPFSSTHNKSVTCNDGWEYDRSQYNTTTITEFNLVCDERSLPSLAQSVYFAGLLVGSLFGGAFSDWIGRKKVVIIGQLVFIGGFLATTFSVNIYMYMAFRFIAGFGNIAGYMGAFVLVLEYVGKSYRTAVTMGVGILYAIGYLILAAIAMQVRDWRNLTLIFSITSVIMLIPLPFLQESIRWLLSKGKIEEAEKVIRKVAKMNKKELPDVLFDKQDIQEQMESRESAIPPSIIDLYKTPNMAVKTLNMQFHWFVNSMVYFGLSQSTGDLGVDDYWAFFISGAVEIPALIYATYGVERFGRRSNTCILELIGGLACLATIFIPIGTWRTVAAMIGKFCISASYGIIYLYCTELFPTPVRAVGLGVSSMTARVGGILSPVILLLGDTLPNLPMIIFGLGAVVAGFLALFLPETRGQKLPQTLAEGEEIGKCRCMGGGRNVDDGSTSDSEKASTSKGDVMAMTNPVFDSSGVEVEDFSQQFSAETCDDSAKE